jgi:hypothetical protein
VVPTRLIHLTSMLPPIPRARTALVRGGRNAAVQELDVNWIAGLKGYPSGAHWMRHGEQLARVFHEDFDAVKTWDCGTGRSLRRSSGRLKPGRRGFERPPAHS